MKTLGVGVAGAVALGGNVSARRGGLQRELAAVRSATASYNDPQNAFDDGYVAEEEAVCEMGYHYPNPGRLDFEANKLEPEILVYGEDDEGNLILGAVEYGVPKSGPFADEPPDVFEHADPEWDILEIPPDAPIPFDALWTLHAWVHSHNPEGVFNHHNPRKQFSPEGCVGH